MKTSSKVLLYLYRDYLKRTKIENEVNTAHHFNEEPIVLKQLNLDLELDQFHDSLEKLSEEGFLHTPLNTFDGYPEFTLTSYAIDSLNDEFDADINKVENSIRSF
ncbi:hypothetical protein [Staphylococcus xylosus]|uniref:hypothetical protein n=1 Tax=Staphylococcus xylosus TaxID=1288 RepID=UPI001CDB85E3|nr:hypothetical protein [Staphylococcus xylosus]MCQ3816692.1 hypothetical protein [Staphylococcus xylosus]MCQ3819255.1 hypothetical protein [Staphylococcus xylosus]UBV36682.1 hypothetical protein JGY88_09470 [Staphylococcus xylosus]